MLFQANWINAGIEDSASGVKGKVTAVAFPVFADGKGAASEFFGGGIDSYYISAKTKYPKEAAEFLAFFSENLGKQGYLAGAGLPCWNADGLDTSKITGLDKDVANLMAGAKNFIPWWDNVLPADASETHKNLIADLFAKNITPEQFVQGMAKVAKSTL
jgi:raffinose/stachyose/melibiose transport system substrate-binding protein